MYHVENLTEKDFEFAIGLTDTMKWELSEDDFRFMLKLEPHGCFILLDNSRKIGIVTTISFGNVGWFGNLIIDENHRKHGAGTLLAKHAANYLASRKAECVGLYAYIDRINFYERLGFEYDSEFTVLKGKGFTSTTEACVRKITKEDVPTIISFDKGCFGASRKKLLEPILTNPNNSGFIAVENGQTVGYTAAKVYEDMAELGPLACNHGRSKIAIALLKANLDRLKRLDVSVCLPKKECAVLRMLVSYGFEESFRVARMFLKPKPRKDCMYIAESLERG